MRKKVIMMLLVAAMAGSSVPTGVMAADVTDFAGEEVGTEENEMEILENTITPIPTETPVPEETIVPESTATPIPTVIPGEGDLVSIPTVTPNPEETGVPEPTKAPSEDFDDGSSESKSGTGEVGVPRYDSSRKMVTFNIKGTEDFTYYVAAFPIGESEETVLSEFDKGKAINKGKANTKISVTFENYDKTTDLWVYFQWPDGSVSCAKEALFLPTIRNLTWIDHNTVQFNLSGNHDFYYYYVVTDVSTTSAEVKSLYNAEKAVNQTLANEKGQITVKNLPDGDDFQVWVYFRMNDGTMKYSKIPVSTDKRPAKSDDQREPHIYTVKDCKVTGLEKPLKFYPDTFYNFKVTGAGTEITNPVIGDEKYEPLYWSTSVNPKEYQQSTNWKIGSAKGITNAGTYTMYVFFQKYRFNGSEWIQRDIEYKTVQFRAAEIKTPRLSATSVTLKTGQSTTAVKVTNQSSGFKVKSWKSSNTSIVKVSSSGKITAGRKTGKATITVTMSNKTTAQVKVTVQKGTVKTKGISGLKSKVTIRKGKTATLKPVLTPVTSQEKITYSTSNKKVATVNSKGVVKGVGKGKATITVRSGKIKKKVAVVIK
nr:Ig-like domain-containing protein [uncultured Blautia sp.]